MTAKGFVRIDHKMICGNIAVYVYEFNFSFAVGIP